MTLDINGKKRLSENSLLETLCLIDTAVAVYTGEELHIEFANPAMLAAWGKTEEVVGGALSEALPEIAGQPFIGMLRKVWTSGIDDVGMAIPAELIVDGRLQLFYFDYAYRAIKNGAGAVYAILHTATNVTEKINAAFEVEKAKEKQFLLEREQALNEELASTNEELYATNEALQSAQEKLRVLNSELESRVALRTAELSRSESRMRYLFSDAPIAIAVLSGRELVVESANKMILQIWGKSAEVIGSPLYLALPELAEQKFLQVLDDVYTSGVVYHGHEEKALLEQNGKLNEVYLNFVYKPLQDENGCVNGIMVTAHAVTEQVVIREQVQKLNQDLNVINEELNESQLRLLNSNHELKMSEERLNRILGELPIPVVVLIGPEQVISTTNQALLELWDRTREEVIGRTMLEVFPELINQPYPGLWKKVLETGERIMRSEIKVVYKHKETGQDRPFYIDYFCQPLENSTGKRIGVISTVFDVSDKVRSKKLIEEAGEQLKLAIDSARLGTWFVDVETRTFNASDRTRELFGYQPEEKMPFDAAIANISETHREQVTKAIENAIVSGESYDMEYPVVAEKDEAPRWLRATGKRYGNAGDKMYFSGIVQDITMRKVEERKKDDFLSIASHELKTPVTTLKGSLQLLIRKKNELSHPSVPRLIDQAYVSVEKITNLIDDLLNTTRTNEGQLHLNYSFFTISHMLNQCCQHIRMGGKHELILQGDAALQIYADEARIDQVVVNFVNNAAKYAPSQKQIFLIIEDLGDRAKISVKDTGPGIPLDRVSHIFDRYYRADYGGAQYSGLGLGLYISAEIIRKHKGEIGVNSKPGEGSNFWFTLPKH